MGSLTWVSLQVPQSPRASRQHQVVAAGRDLRPLNPFESWKREAVQTAVSVLQATQPLRVLGRAPPASLGLQPPTTALPKIFRAARTCFASSARM